uniref:Uncharacterized protein n=1 Tax=Cicer arietinum TaxID=3827 RepID=A0A3Q7Y436_CICAR|nr:putative uncharacterized protein DDB_G0290521 [Cicer arietinum]
MARTKVSARKNPNPRTPSPSSSPSPSPSPTRSPSPPPKPTPTHSSSERTLSELMSSSPESSPSPITPTPLSTILPPLYQCGIPTIHQTLPHLRNTLKTRSISSSSKCRSMRILSGIGTSKSKTTDQTIYTIYDDEFDSTPLPKIPTS